MASAHFKFDNEEQRLMNRMKPSNTSSACSVASSIWAAMLALTGCGGPGATHFQYAPSVKPIHGEAPSSQKYRVLYSFQTAPDGDAPQAGLTDVNGTLFGTTEFGGAYDGGGTVFSITTSGSEKVLHSFGNGTDGISPLAPLIAVKGTLYGTTEGAGAYTCFGRSVGCGTVFSITKDGTEKVLHSFSKGTDGAYPYAGLIDVHGTLFGTTAGGGAYGDGGTFFSITTDGTEAVLHSFGGGTDGTYPAAALIDVNGKLLSTTQNGGAFGMGTVFSVTTAGDEKVLHSFGKGKDGASPVSGLIDVRGTLYGTSAAGGTYGKGTIFRMSLSGEEKVIHNFGKGTDGASPEAGLVSAKGALYGATAAGGAYGKGTVFRVRLSGKEKILHSFGYASDGISPDGSLIDVNGTLFGTTYGGGTNGQYGYGVVFMLNP